ncbi:MAG: PAS domain-containing protein [Proteobacteria bacterium]|nr:PAS domain-containing protein [Pseudomonadota bacterium]
MDHSIDILENISTGIIGLDGRLTVVSINSAAQALLEVSMSRTIGVHADQLVLHPDEWLQDLKQALLNNAPLTQRGMTLNLLSGHEIHVDLTVNPVLDKQGEMGLLVEIQAIDRLLKISREESIQHAQETTKTVIRSLAHEIKNPLAGVRGAAQLLARELPGDHLGEYTQIIIKEADRLRDLVDRLLGPRQELSMAPLNIHEVLEHLRKLIRAESDNKVEILRDYDPSLPDTPGDKAQLIQAVLNIMRNALQAATQAEDCVLTLRTRSQRQFTIGATRHRLVCRVDISDNGPGIPENLMHAIFVPMVTGKAEGTGLGLAISQSIINHHGGLLECSSRPGKTTFTIFLPMETKDAQ